MLHGQQNIKKKYIPLLSLKIFYSLPIQYCCPYNSPLPAALKNTVVSDVETKTAIKVCPCVLCTVKGKGESIHKNKINVD